MLLICLTVQVVSAEGKLSGRVGRKGRKRSEASLFPHNLFSSSLLFALAMLFLLFM